MCAKNYFLKVSPIANTKSLYFRKSFPKKEERMVKPYLDNITQTFIDNVESRGGKPVYEITPEDARKFLCDLQKEFYSQIEAQVDDVSIFNTEHGEISVRLVRPVGTNDEKLPLIVYCHGGGWVMGDADAFDMTIKTIANYTKSVVAFVNYNRAPEFQYPEALNQICDTVNYFANNGGDYNINSERIAIAGDSAGGNMAAAALIKMKKEGGPKLCFQALIYPVTDADMNSDSYKEFKNGPWLTKKAMEYFFDSYVPDKNKRKEVYVSPLKAEVSELYGLPPALVITAENDVLRDEGEAYARKLIEAGIDTACVRINNTCHDFILLNALRDSKATKAGYKLLCKFLNRALYN